MEKEEWLTWRRSGIGGSDAAVIMGVSPWKTPFQLWEEKVFGTVQESDNWATRKGKSMEEPARIHFESMTNTVVAPDYLQNAKIPWLRASVDGIDIDKKVLVEIKCPGREDHQHAVNGKVPDKYYPQCQHYLAVTGLDKMYYFSYDGISGVIVDVPRNPTYIEDMLEKEKLFWELVITQIPPEGKPEDIMDLGNNADWEFLMSKWEMLDTQIKALKTEKDEIRGRLILLSQGKSAIGGRFKLSKSICRGDIDYDKAFSDYVSSLRAQYPEIDIKEISKESYRKSSFLKWTIKAI